MKALLVDDERLARTELRRLLADHPQIEIAGEAANADQARKQLAALKPDLIFLDVQMPKETGLQLLESLEPPVPLIIFTTAFDEFAVKAFDLNALDYLLKPVDPARLEAALQKLPAGPPAERTGEPAGRLAADDKVFLREGDLCWFVEVKQIRLLESEGNYVRVHFAGGKPLLFRSLNAMEERLDPKVFFRAKRRQIVNLAAIERIDPWFSGGLIVVLQGGARIELSRRQAHAFREKMSL